MDCLFCKIAAGTIPAKRLVEDEHGLAFPDINPQAPFHALVIPKAHVASVNEVADPAMMGRLFALAARLAREQGFAESGYRVVINTGPHAQQSVFHLHLHVIGGRQMNWPPG